jgi:hypothetical protein
MTQWPWAGPVRRIFEGTDGSFAMPHSVSVRGCVSKSSVPYHSQSNRLWILLVIDEILLKEILRCRWDFLEIPLKESVGNLTSASISLDKQSTGVQSYVMISLRTHAVRSDEAEAVRGSLDISEQWSGLKLVLMLSQ